MDNIILLFLSFDREEAFKKYVATLPDLLLKPSIDEATIHIISKLAIRFKEWIQHELTIKQEAIAGKNMQKRLKICNTASTYFTSLNIYFILLDNAKKINIVGSHDDKASRLMICNLLYFVDGELYY